MGSELSDERFKCGNVVLKPILRLKIPPPRDVLIHVVSTNVTASQRSTVCSLGNLVTMALTLSCVFIFTLEIESVIFVCFYLSAATRGI